MGDDKGNDPTVRGLRSSSGECRPGSGGTPEYAGVEVGLVDGKPGKLTSLVDGRLVAKKGLLFKPSSHTLLQAVRAAESPRRWTPGLVDCSERNRVALHPGWAAEATAELSGAKETAAKQRDGGAANVAGRRPNAGGESCGLGGACNVWGSLLGLGESSLGWRHSLRDLWPTRKALSSNSRAFRFTTELPTGLVVKNGYDVGKTPVPPISHSRVGVSHGVPVGMANLSVEEPDALMHARPGPWEPWRVTARATQPEHAKWFARSSRTLSCRTDYRHQLPNGAGGKRTRPNARRLNPED